MDLLLQFFIPATEKLGHVAFVLFICLFGILPIEIRS